MGFVTDRMLRRGRLPDAKLVVLPEDSRLEPDVREALETFVGRGGHSLTVGSCLTWGPTGDEGSRTLSGPGERVRQIEEIDRERLNEAFARAGVHRRVRALTTSGNLPEHPVECRTATVDGRTVCYLLGLNKEAQNVRLLVDGRPIAAWQDLVSGETGVGPQFRIEPLDVRLLTVER